MSSIFSIIHIIKSENDLKLSNNIINNKFKNNELKNNELDNTKLKNTLSTENFIKFEWPWLV